MKLVKIFLVVFAAGMILACSSAEKKADKSQAEINEQRIELTEKYQKCMEKAGDDQAKQAQYCGYTHHGLGSNVRDPCPAPPT